MVLALTAAMSGRSTAEEPPLILDPEDDSHYFILFDGSTIQEPPFVLDSRLAAAFDSGIHTYPHLGFVRRIQHVHPRTSDLYEVRGPWLVTCTLDERGSAASPEDAVAATLPDGTIADITTMADPEDVEEHQLGESNRVYFPSEANQVDGSLGGAFCDQPGNGDNRNGLVYFHAPNPSEIPRPTLLDADTDECAWQLDDLSVDGLDMDLPQAWAITRGSPDVVVAVLDTGFDWEHWDLFGRASPGFSDLEDLLKSDGGPSLFRNTQDPPGEDDFGSDPTGVLPGNTHEADVIIGKWTAVADSELTCAGSNWAPGELVGLQVVPSYGEAAVAHLSEQIIWNDEDTIRTTGSGYLGHVRHLGLEGWSTYVDPGAVFKISDMRDTDGDGVPDDHWDFSPLDGDANGYADDHRGVTVEASSGADGYLRGHEQYGNPDVRPTRPSERHGTQVLGLLNAQTDPSGIGMIGVAPGIRVVPVRFTTKDVPTRIGVARALDYALNLEEDGEPVVDIVVMATGMANPSLVGKPDWDCAFLQRTVDGELVDPLARAMERAAAQDVLIVNGSGNTDTVVLEPSLTGCWPQTLMVGGHNRRGLPHYHAHLDGGMTAAPWVDLMAWTLNVPTLSYGIVDTTAGTQQHWGLQHPSAVRFWGDGTSWGSPQVGGVAALMKSAYPHMTAPQIHDKIIGSTDPLLPEQRGPDWSELEGNVGSGRMNAYKALTVYGPVSTTAPDTTWSGTVWVSGDIVVPEGKTLHIAPGTTIKVAQDDIANVGNEPTIIEFFVDGDVEWIGGLSSAIVFEMFADSPDSVWIPPAFGPHASGSALNLRYEGFELDTDALTSDFTGIHQSPGDTVTIQWSTDHLTVGGNSAFASFTHEHTVDLSGSLDGGLDFLPIASGVPASAGGYEWTIGEEFLGGPILLQAEFRDLPGTVVGTSTAIGPAVLRLDPFLNVSEASGIDIPEGSTPYASATLDYDEDGEEDLLVSFEDQRARLYASIGPVGNEVSFLPRSTDHLANGAPIPGRGVNVVDYDNDGHPDVFIAGTTRSWLLEGSGSDLNTDVTASRFDPGVWDVASTAAAWGDYDRDGSLDLYLLRPAGDLLLHSENGGGAFVDETAEAGLVEMASSTTSAMWADVDRDDLPDLFVAWGAAVDEGADSLAWSPLYVNEGPAPDGQVTFDDRAAGPSPSFPRLGHIQAVDFADLDGDAWIDLILARDDPAPTDGRGNLIALLSEQSASFQNDASTLGLFVSSPAQDVEVTDLDGNGVLDVVVLPRQDPDPLVFSGSGVRELRSYLDTSADLGLGAGVAYGINVADFNGDSDADVLLLRPQIGSGGSVERSFFYANPRFSGTPTAGEAEFLTIGFDAGPHGANRMGIGATVLVKIVSPHGFELSSTQVVDGGSGRGSQGARRLVFGLGGAPTAEIHVTWPNGGKELFPDAAALPGFPHVTLTDTHNPHPDAGTLTYDMELLSSSATRHTWQWRSLYDGGEPIVRVAVSGRPTTACMVLTEGNPELVLEDGVSGVLVDSVPVAGGFQHTLEWTTYCSSPCTYTYAPGHLVNGAEYTDGGGTFTIGVCAEITW